MNVIWRCFEVLIALIALIMAIGAIGLFGMQLEGFPYLGFVALIIYLLIPRKWGVIGFSVAIIVACVYLAHMLLFAFFRLPVSCLMSIILSMGATYPSQWFHCYRFFWMSIVVETVSEYA